MEWTGDKLATYSWTHVLGDARRGATNSITSGLVIASSPHLLQYKKKIQAWKYWPICKKNLMSNHYYLYNGVRIIGKVALLLPPVFMFISKQYV